MQNPKLAKLYKEQFGIILKTPEQIAGIRKACMLAASVLDKTCQMAKIGITTNQLNDFAHKLQIDAGAIPAPLGFGEPPYPKSICTSLNEVICHGIPNDIPLKNGDIVNIDVSCSINGYYGDCSRMVVIGKIDEEKRRVVDVSYECLMRSIAILKPGVPLCEIGNTIEKYAILKGCTVAEEFAGHGIGLFFREPPEILHHRNRIAIPLAEGMTFTIEPMINAGVGKAVLDEDGWTARTLDGKPSAQWEHQILITANGHEILTPFPEPASQSGGR
jgi:methionyl aminopeptidase